jgi:hypothetical protein
MGADMMLAVVDITEPKQRWLDATDQITDADLFACFRDTWVIWKYEDDERYWNHDVKGDEPEPTPALMTELRVELMDAIRYAYEFHRDCQTLHIADRVVAVTGGLCFGDDPTDSYSVLNLVAEFQYYIDNMKEVTA